MSKKHPLVADLERAMLAKGMSRKDLCTKAEISYMTLYRWLEAGQAPDVETLEKALKVVGLKLKAVEKRKEP